MHVRDVEMDLQRQYQERGEDPPRGLQDFAVDIADPSPTVACWMFHEVLRDRMGFTATHPPQSSTRFVIAPLDRSARVRRITIKMRFGSQVLIVVEGRPAALAESIIADAEFVRRENGAIFATMELRLVKKGRHSGRPIVSDCRIYPDGQLARVW